MPNRSITISELRELIQKGEGKDPLVFLEAIMNGQDPRKISKIYELIIDIDDFSEGDIDQSDWQELVNTVMLNHRYHPVSVNDSMAASKTLAEYLYPKRKQVELTGDGTDGGSKSPAPLTEEDITVFWEKHDEYDY